MGLRWLGSDGRVYRAAWVEDTGELTLIQLGRPGDGGGHVEVLGVFAGRAELEHALAGWREECGSPVSADWLRDRAAIGALTAV